MYLCMLLNTNPCVCAACRLYTWCWHTFCCVPSALVTEHKQQERCSCFPTLQYPTVSVCRCLRTRHFQAQRPTFCELSWRVLQPAQCSALPATSLPMRKGAWTRLRTSPRPPPLTWGPLLLGPTATPISRSKVGGGCSCCGG